MADKELTVFVVDTSAPWTSYDYLFQTLASKLLKGLKTDYVSVVAFNAATTHHTAADTGKFVGVNVLMDFETVTFEGLKDLRSTLSSLCNPQEPLSPKRSDAIQTILFCSQLFKPTLKKVFTRNLVLIASNEPTSTDLLDRIPDFYQPFPCNLHVILQDEKVPQIYESLCSNFSSGKAFSAAAAADAIAHHHPVKKTRPVTSYKGKLRFGADFPAALHGPADIADTDDFSATFDIELYPAVKSESASSLTHDYVVVDDEVVKIKRITSHYVLEKNPQANASEDLAPHFSKKEADDVEKSYDKLPVDSQSLAPGLKFSNFDLIALDDDLIKSTKLELGSAFDILGFIKYDSLPQHFFTGEPLYAVPEKASTLRNTTSFLAFAEALYAKSMAALCRFIRKQEKEVEVGALIPVKIKRSNDYMPCLLYIRLPFKEDEKIGNFPPLSKTSKPMEDENYDEEAVNALMEEFIETRTANEDIEENAPNVIDNPKVTLLASETSKLCLPPKDKTTSPLLSSSPAVAKFHNYLQKVVLSSLDATDWVSHFMDPEFVQRNIREENSPTNFYTLENCLRQNSTFDISAWLGKKDSGAEKRLVEKLDIKYERKEDSKKQKVTASDAAHTKGNYGADEGDYGEVPDFGL